MIRWIFGWFKRHETFRRKEWARVPPPEWAAKRGGRDYW